MFDGYNIDFRNKEMLNYEYMLSENAPIYKDSIALTILANRHERFSKYVALEVIPFLKEKYNASDAINLWTMGGFSNGGAFVFSFAGAFPGLVGNAIIMSPGGRNEYNVINSNCKYYLCAGTDEPDFLSNSTAYIDLMIENHIPFMHRTYNSGHSWNMWLDFYLNCIRSIYGNDSVVKN